MTPPPAILFLIFNRPETTSLVMETIRAARPPRLYVAADGARPRPGEAERCETARRIATDVDWPCEVKTLFRDRNLGCRVGVSTAIDWFFETEEEGIILEDDCLPSMDFFAYCAELLDRHRNDERVMAICGSAYPEVGDYPSSYYFSYYADMWGWASWRRAWRHYDSRLKGWPAFKAQGGLDSLAAGRAWHADYWTRLFDATRDGRVDSWGYGWIFTVIEQGGLASFPTCNMISNLGYGPDATHTVVTSSTLNPLANRPHAKLEFPLVHPTHFARSAAMEREIEALRLTLTPPPAVGRLGSLADAMPGARRALTRLRGSWRRLGRLLKILQ